MSLRALLIATAVSYALGAGSGAFVTFRVVSYGAQAKALQQARSELQRYQRAVGLAAEIDDDAIKLEITNEDIAQAVIRTANKARADDGSARVCVSGRSMCQLGQIKLFTSPATQQRPECGEDDRLALVAERETTELIARLRASEAKNAQAVNDCKRYWAQVNKMWSGK